MEEDALTRVDKLKETVAELEYKSKYTSQNRKALLVVHSFLGMFVGSAIIQEGGPTSFKTLGIWGHTEFLLGVVPLISGVILLMGLSFGRVLFLEGIGMLGLLAWDAYMTSGFVYAYSIGVSITHYPIWVYLGLTCFMLIHLRTFFKFMRQAF